MRRLLLGTAAAVLAASMITVAGQANAADTLLSQGKTGQNVVRVAEFLADCPFSHRLPDDPIIFPNLPGASHMHSFFGATNTDAYSTVDTLLNANSNCNPSVDKSSYWIPTLYRDNVPVEPVTGIFYYLGEGCATT